MTVFVKRYEKDEWIDARVANVWDGTWPNRIWIKMSDEHEQETALQDAQYAALSSTQKKVTIWVDEVREAEAAMLNGEFGLRVPFSITDPVSGEKTEVGLMLKREDVDKLRKEICVQ
jgi:hypothetical protein